MFSAFWLSTSSLNTAQFLVANTYRQAVLACLFFEFEIASAITAVACGWPCRSKSWGITHGYGSYLESLFILAWVLQPFSCGTRVNSFACPPPRIASTDRIWGSRRKTKKHILVLRTCDATLILTPKYSYCVNAWIIQFLTPSGFLSKTNTARTILCQGRLMHYWTKCHSDTESYNCVDATPKLVQHIPIPFKSSQVYDFISWQ